MKLILKLVIDVDRLQSVKQRIETIGGKIISLERADEEFVKQIGNGDLFSVMRVKPRKQRQVEEGPK